MPNTRAGSRRSRLGSQETEPTRLRDDLAESSRTAGPSTGSEQAAQHPEDRGRIQEELDEEHRNDAMPLGSDRTPSSQSGPIRPETPNALQDMEAWYKRVQDQEKLKHLMEIRARYEAGDPDVIEEIMQSQMGGSSRPATATSALPRPEPPQQFKKKDRAEYNRWERDCEGYFKRAPLNFKREQQKVDFGAMYVSEPLKTLWRAHCSEKSVLPGWFPTWVELKLVMLNSLGTPGERKQRAYEQLMKAKQLPTQSPTELLDYLRPFWEELGTEYTPQLQVLGYVSALRPEIREDVERLPIGMRSLLWQVEEQANIVYRRLNQRRTQKEATTKTREFKHTNLNPQQEGQLRDHKRRKRGRPTQSGPLKDEKSGSGPKPKKVTCYNCGEPGHMSPDCTNPKKPGADPRTSKTEKGKGQKN